MPVLQSLAVASAKALGQVRNTSKGYNVAVTTNSGDPYRNKVVFHLEPVTHDGTNTSVNNYSSSGITLSVTGRPYMGSFGPICDTGYSFAVTSYRNSDSGGLPIGDVTPEPPHAFYSGSAGRWNFGTGDFTIELWFLCNKLDTTTAGFDGYLISSGSFAPNGTNFYLTLKSNNTIEFSNNGLGPIVTSAVNAWKYNTWHHIMVTRSGNILTMYVDGKATGSTSGTVSGASFGGTTEVVFNKLHTNFGDGTTAFKGFISSVRLVKGQSLVDGNFLPSRVPVSDTVIGHTGGTVAGSITGTPTCWFTTHGSLSSFCSDGTVINPSSTYGKTLIVAFSPFARASGNVKATTYGIYNEQGSYIDTSGSADLRFLGGAGNSPIPNQFTIEGWCYWADEVNSNVVPIFELGSHTDGIYFGNTVTGAASDIIINSSNTFARANSFIIPYQWFHYAFTRDEAFLCNTYINGRLAFSANVPTTINSTAAALRIGGSRSLVPGNISKSHHSQIRVVKGNVVYTGNFVPPALAPLQLDGANSAACYANTTNVNTTFIESDTKLLIRFDNPAIHDKSGIMNISVVGSARPKDFGPFDNNVNSTLKSVQTTGSSGNYIAVKNYDRKPFPLEWLTNSSNTVGRIDFWVYPLSLETGNKPPGQGEAILGMGNGVFNIGIYNNQLRVYTSNSFNSNAFITGTRPVRPYQWTHVSVIYDSVIDDLDDAFPTYTDFNARIIQDGQMVASGRLDPAILRSGPVGSHRELYGSNSLITIGTEAFNQANSSFNGYISDLRISYGEPRGFEYDVPKEPYADYSEYVTQVFSSGSGNITSSVCEVLIVAGGGGGGAGTAASGSQGVNASGGGGGGILHTTTLALQRGTYKVVVGAGGSRSQYGTDSTQFYTTTGGIRPQISAASRGGNSYIITPSNITYKAIGGGRGLGSDATVAGSGNGGSGGGGNVLAGASSIGNTVQTSQAPFTGYGNNGNAGNIHNLAANVLVSGGGGGAGAPGGNNFTLPWTPTTIDGIANQPGFTAGAGGDGRAFFTDGYNSPIYYGGGGAGSGVRRNGTALLYGFQPGGLGGGAYTSNTESYSNINQYDGVPNSGGGGAGISAIANYSTTGGAGGSGTVIFRYPEQYPKALTTGKVKYKQKNGYHIYKFYTTGTFTL